jgi:phosphate transport system substrate-binding protein
VDFGASDEPLPPADLQRHALLQFPTLIGGLVPAVNIKGVKTGDLRLTPQVLARIYAGQARRWNDPEIAALNPTLQLPAQPIRRIVREEASGGTRAWTEYLARHDKAFEAKVGVGQKVNWPGEVLSGRGNKGVTELLKATEGAIGYVSYQEVVRHQLTAARLRNKDGQFVLPNERSFLAAVAASGLGRTEDDQGKLLDMGGAESWPLTEATYVLLPKVPADAQRARRTLSFFYWVFAQGDAMAADTGFVPVPTRLQARVLGRFREIVGPDGKPIEYLGSLPATQVSAAALAH